MKKANIFLFLLFLNIMALFAQPQIRITEYDVESLDTTENLVFALYNLQNDGHVSVYASDSDYNKLLISSYEFNYDELDEYVNSIITATKLEVEEYSYQGKEELSEQFLRRKENLREDLFLFFNKFLLQYSISKDGENSTCASSLPFCTSDVISFIASTTGVCENGPYYGCLSPYTQRPPAWYHMRIANPGAFNIRMQSNPSLDIDFCCWGPFDDPIEPCVSGLTQNKYVSCGSSGASVETCMIPNTAQTGDYYIFVITLYNVQNNVTISFTKQEGSGPGTTDCSILPPLVEYNNACYGETLYLSAQEIANASYSWTGPNGFTSTIREPHIDNVTFANSGTYSCSISVPGQGTSDPMELDVEILPELHANFTVANAVPGAPAQFTGTETTTPSGYTDKVTSWGWDFGDGSPEVYEANPTHVYTTPGSYDVTYTIVAENETGGTCEDTKTITITVANNLSAMITCGDETLCEGEQTTISVMPSGGTGNYTYTWTPAGLPATQSITVSPSETTTYTCVVSDGYNETTVQQTIAVYPQYPEAVLNDLGKGCQPYHVTEHLVFYESVDDDYNLGTIHGCDSVIHFKFIKYDEPVVPLINDVERKEVMAGSSWMPLQYKFSLENVTGAGIEQGEPIEYHWSIEYHVDWTGFDNTETWILNEDGTNEATLLVLSGGNATIHCNVVTICGTIHRSIFVYSDFYGIEDNEYSNFISVYPNPTSNTFNIELSESVNNEDVSINIYSTSGSLIDSFINSGSNIEYSMNGLANGLYFIKITGKDFNVIKRITLNR